MSALSPPESLKPRALRRVSKPLMEKRRRERINHSLEALRLLMLENTHNEKLKNPKVEKAEILESVVQFLKTEKDVDGGRSLSGEQRRACGRQSSYGDGMRSCLLRVSSFIASQSRESGGGSARAPRALPSSPGRIQRAAPSPQRLSRPCLGRSTGLHGDTGTLLSSAAASTHITDPVWRPWPQ